MKKKKIRILLIINILIAFFVAVVYPALVMEVWDVATLVGMVGAIILIEIPIVAFILIEDDKK